MVLSGTPRFLSLAVGTMLLTSGLVPLASSALAATGAPVVVSPEYGDSVPSNPVLDWSPVTGAVKYRVQISTKDTFSPALFAADTYATRATPPVDLPFGNLYWRVAGIDAANAVGEWTDPILFSRSSIAGPTPVAPSDNAVLDYPTEPPVLQWLAVPAMKEYEVTVDDNDVFSSPEVFRTSSTQLALSEPLTLDKEHFWKVRGVSVTAGVTTSDSPVRSFTTRWPTKPVAISPTNAEPVDHMELEWTPVPGAAYYEVQVSPNGNFTNNLTALDGKTTQKVFGTRFSTTAQLPVTSYFWQVRAVDAATVPHPSAYSDPVQFTLQPPTRPTNLRIDAPRVAGDVYDPAFSWTGVPRASRYEIALSSNGFTTENTCITMHTTFTPYRVSAVPALPGGNQTACNFVLNPGTPYEWRVRALDDAPGGGANPAFIPGGWSDTQSFVYRQDVPVALSPASGTATQAPVLSWAPVDDHGQYEVTVAPTSFTGVTHVQKTFATTYTPVGSSATTAPVRPGDYVWSVRKVADDGTAGPQPFSARAITIAPPVAGDGPVSLTGPAFGASSVDMPSMTWTPVQGASYYRVFAASMLTDSYFPLVPDKLFLPAVTKYDDVLPAGDYKWFVKAYSAAGVDLGLDSAVSRFSVVAPSHPAPAGSAACSVPAPCPKPENDTPQLRWAESEGATHYQVTLAGDEAFTNKLRVYETQHRTLTPRDALPDNQAGESYYWFVQACRDDDGCPPADVSKTELDAGKKTFRKQSLPVELVEPVAGADLKDQVRFSWRDWFQTNIEELTSSGARSYRLQVATDVSFSSIVEDVKVDQPVHTPWAKAYPDGVYYWRVQAVDGADQGLTWSETRTFSKVSSVPTQQVGVVSGTSPTLTWSPLAFSGSYMVEVYSGEDKAFPLANRVLTATTKYAALTPAAPLGPGTYSWRVRKLDAAKNPGPWSAGVPTFTVAPLPPTLVAPAEGVTVSTNEQIFTWAPPSGTAVSSYLFESSLSPGFTTTNIEAKRTVMTSWVPTALYADGKTYYWRVHLLDSAGAVFATSPVRSFYKDGKPPVVAGVSASVPVVGPVTVTFDEAVKGLTASSVQVKVADSSTAVSGTVSGNGTSTASFTPKTPLVPGQRYAVVLSGAITDTAGNRLVPVTLATRAATVVEAESPAVTHRWDVDTSSSANGGSDIASATKGSELNYTFSGSSVAVLGRTAPDGGTAAYYVDGVRLATASSYSSSVAWQKTLVSKTGLSTGAHTLRVVVTGSRPSGSTGSWVYVDAVKVGSTVVQQDRLRQSFATVANTSASGGSHVLATHTTGGDTGAKPEYAFAVRGTTLKITGTKLPRGGQAEVWVDGVSRGVISTYGSVQTNKATLLSLTGLSDTVHQVKVVVLGTRVGTSSGYDVALDTVGTT